MQILCALIIGLLCQFRMQSTSLYCMLSKNSNLKWYSLTSVIYLRCHPLMEFIETLKRNTGLLSSRMEYYLSEQQGNQRLSPICFLNGNRSSDALVLTQILPAFNWISLFTFDAQQRMTHPVTVDGFRAAYQKQRKKTSRLLLKYSKTNFRRYTSSSGKKNDTSFESWLYKYRYLNEPFKARIDGHYWLLG